MNNDIIAVQLTESGDAFEERKDVQIFLEFTEEQIIQDEHLCVTLSESSHMMFGEPGIA